MTSARYRYILCVACMRPGKANGKRPWRHWRAADRVADQVMRSTNLIAPASGYGREYPNAKEQHKPK